MYLLVLIWIGKVLEYMSERPTAGTSWHTAEFKGLAVCVQSIMYYRTFWYIVSNVWAEPAAFAYVHNIRVLFDTEYGSSKFLRDLSTKPHSVTSHQKVRCTRAAVRTSNHVYEITTVHKLRCDAKWRHRRRPVVTYPLKQQVQGRLKFVYRSCLECLFMGNP